MYHTKNLIKMKRTVEDWMRIFVTPFFDSIISYQTYFSD